MAEGRRKDKSHIGKIRTIPFHCNTACARDKISNDYALTRPRCDAHLQEEPVLSEPGACNEQAARNGELLRRLGTAAVMPIRRRSRTFVNLGLF